LLMDPVSTEERIKKGKRPEGGEKSELVKSDSAKKTTCDEQKIALRVYRERRGET